MSFRKREEDKLMNIGLFGGSFNPIHNGHIALADNFVRDLNLDKLILMPANIPPHKSAEYLASGADRLNMCRLAAKRIKNAEASDFELSRNQVSYTVDTLEELFRLYEDKVYLIMGTDMFLSLQNWRNAKRIFELAIPCASARSENEYEKLCEHSKNLNFEYGAQCIVRAFPVIELSSTEIREKISLNEDCTDLIDIEVLKYINENGLFRGKNND